MSQTTTMHIIVHGHVQGVFFRATTSDHARSLGITGTVKNIADGTVEIWAQGSKDNLEAFLNKLKKEPGQGQVAELETDYPESSKQFSSFEVAY